MPHVLAVRIAATSADRQNDRDRYLDAHKLHLREASIRIVLSGPVFDADGVQTGAVVIAEVESLEDLQTFSDEDPFVVHGIYDSVIVRRWTATIDNRQAT